jgi:hypothetical protein
MLASEEGIAFAADGRGDSRAAFRTLEAAWMDGIAAMVRAGARIIIDDEILGGAASPAAVVEGPDRNSRAVGRSQVRQRGCRRP